MEQSLNDKITSELINHRNQLKSLYSILKYCAFFDLAFIYSKMFYIFAKYNEMFPTNALNI